MWKGKRMGREGSCCDHFVLSKEGSTEQLSCRHKDLSSKSRICIKGGYGGVLEIEQSLRPIDQPIQLSQLTVSERTVSKYEMGRN